MKFKRSLQILRFILGWMLFGTASPASVSATEPDAVTIGENDLGGAVTSAKGPEAGVWVIAETDDLPTKLAKIVVTDDNGRYLIPDLPKANYRVWVRGYGLVDSPKTKTAPGEVLNLVAVAAPSAAAAAEYYPAIYWYSLLRIPAASEFPGTGDKGNGMPESLKSQEQWLDVVKTDGCYTCHQLGDKATRTIPKELGTFASSTDAWERRIQAGQVQADDRPASLGEEMPQSRHADPAGMIDLHAPFGGVVIPVVEDSVPGWPTACHHRGPGCCRDRRDRGAKRSCGAPGQQRVQIRHQSPVPHRVEHRPGRPIQP